MVTGACLEMFAAEILKQLSVILNIRLHIEMKPAIHLHFLYKYQLVDNEQGKCENHSKHTNALCDENAFFKQKSKLVIRTVTIMF